MSKMWEGRFSKALDTQADDFNSSIHFDSRMFRQDIQGSMAHAAMLAAKGIIGKNDAEVIIAELGNILEDIQNGALPIDLSAEDIHMFVEAELTKRIGDLFEWVLEAQANKWLQRTSALQMDAQLEVKGKNDMGRPSVGEQGPQFIFQSSFYTLRYA